jgi:hypothetical protein
MSVLLIIAVAVIIFGVANYDKMSYKKWYERCEVNSKHPGWTPKCGIDFLEKDPQWFIDNGYGNYVRH